MIKFIILFFILILVYFGSILRYNIRHMNTFYLIRGLPGSGKTTYAKELASTLKIKNHFEADMYFTVNGVYQFNKDEIGDAHFWCANQFFTALRKKENVIVSNTFTRWREMREYVESALEEGYQVHVIECLGNYGSIHNVPTEALEKMRQRWISNKDLPQQKGIIYTERVNS